VQSSSSIGHGEGHDGTARTRRFALSLAVGGALFVATIGTCLFGLWLSSAADVRAAESAFAAAFGVTWSWPLSLYDFLRGCAENCERYTGHIALVAASPAPFVALSYAWLSGRRDQRIARALRNDVALSVALGIGTFFLVGLVLIVAALTSSEASWRESARWFGTAAYWLWAWPIRLVQNLFACDADCGLGGVGMGMLTVLAPAPFVVVASMWFRSHTNKS
jgi:hypothetical protein